MPVRLLLIALLLAGCEGKVRKSAPKLERRGDAPPVVVVDREIRGTTSLSEEAEPNDEPGAAMKVAAPGGVRGTLASEADVDVFRFEVGEDGMLAVVVSGIEGVDVLVEVVAGTKVLFSSDRGGADTAEGFPNLPVSKGDGVVVRVSEFVSKGRLQRRKRGKDQARSEAAPYELRAELVGPGNHDEVEPNDDGQGARELLLGDRGQGFIGWNKDVDDWRVSLLGFSAGYALDVDVRGVPGAELTLEVRDDKGKVVLRRSAGKGQDVFVRNLEPVVGLPHYVLRLSASRSNPEEGYVVSASSHRLEPGEEIEPNDDKDKATEVAGESGQGRGEGHGYLVSGDVDRFRLPAPAVPSVLNVSLDVPATSDLSLTVEQAGAMLAKADAAKVGGPERLVGVPVESGSPIDVVITGALSGDAPGSYRFTWEVVGGGAGGPVDDLE